MTEHAVNRRQFATSIAVASAGLHLGTESPEDTTVNAEEADKPRTDKEEPKPGPVDLMLDFIQQQYADERLNEEVLKNIHKELIGDFARAQILSLYPLKNSDEPGFVFAAFRGDNEE